MSRPTGIPLLSGPPPGPGGAEKHCRKCDKDIGGLFTRARRCQHCGFKYCPSCSDYQALMRKEDRSGYDSVNVCAYCIENLTITACGRAQLKSLKLSKLRDYLDAYNIDRKGALEKDDLIDKIIAARGPNGCLPFDNEEFYRRHSVPNKPSTRDSDDRNFLQRTFDNAASTFQSAVNPPHTQAPHPPPHGRGYPGQQPYHAQQPYAPHGYAYAPPPGAPPGGQQRPPHAHPPPPHAPRAQPSPYARPSAAASHSNLHNPPPARPPTTSTPRPRSTPPTPRRAPEEVPGLDALLNMTRDAVGRLSIHVLKEVLHRNHVMPGQVLEKAELVEKVVRMLDGERADRARDAALRAQEEQDAARAREEARRREEGGSAQAEKPPRDDGADPASDLPVAPDVPAPSAAPRPLSPKAEALKDKLERTGLCVICQDEEANIAIVDCGHLCMCRDCSELVMKGTRECPLCRTRIVTEQRLLRIYRT